MGFAFLCVVVFPFALFICLCWRRRRDRSPPVTRAPIVRDLTDPGRWERRWDGGASDIWPRQSADLFGFGGVQQQQADVQLSEMAGAAGWLGGAGAWLDDFRHGLSSLIQADPHENEVRCVDLQLSSERTIFQKREVEYAEEVRLRGAAPLGRGNLATAAATAAATATERGGTGSARGRQPWSWPWRCGQSVQAAQMRGQGGSCMGAAASRCTPLSVDTGGDDRGGSGGGGGGGGGGEGVGESTLSLPMGSTLLQRLGGIGDMIASSPLGQVHPVVGACVGKGAHAHAHATARGLL